MASLITSLSKDFGMPIYDNAEFAKGCDNFLFRAKSERECWRLYREFLETLPRTCVAKAYKLGFRPDYPVPVGRYFIEVAVENIGIDTEFLKTFWTSVDRGRLKHDHA